MMSEVAKKIDNMMTSKERIKRILDFKTPDRIGIMDMFWSETKRNWQALLNKEPEEHFDMDIRVLDCDRDIGRGVLNEFFSEINENRFLALSIRDPFQRYVDDVGLEIALENIGKDPKGAFKNFKKGLDEVLTRAIGILDKGYDFDGIWVFGDLAHKTGIFFSKEFYEKYLFPFHKEICYFFASYGIPTILHSDGNVSPIILLLIKAGFRALHPLQYTAGMDVELLKKEYKNDLVFFGNFDIDLLTLPKERVRSFLVERLEVFKEGGGYIFGLDGPIGPSAKIEDYSFILNIVKRYGRY